jgi:hypothetical protein
VLEVAKEARKVRIDSRTDLMQLIEDVRRDGQPRIVEKEGKSLAAVIDIDDLTKVVTAEPTAEDVTTAFAMAGSWSDVDAAALKRSIREGRRAGSRPVSRPA